MSTEATRNEILDLLKTIWDESPEIGLLELIGSCFAAGDISHISDDELKKNLAALLSVDRERKARIKLSLHKAKMSNYGR